MTYLNILFTELRKTSYFFILSLNTDNVFAMCDVFDYSYKKLKVKI